MSARTFLALSRAANLPTVWSNCLAGWWLSGGGQAGQRPLLLFAGATFLYLGGAFLNDVFDERYDRQFRRARPIPRGALTPVAVLRWGLAWLVLGEVCLFCLGQATGGLGLALALCAAVYNATHRLFTFSPMLLGLCRFFLYVIAASAGAGGVSGWSIWCGLALAGYVTGARCLPRPENTRGRADYWPVLLLAAPILLALLMDVGRYRLPGLELSAVFGLWVLYCLRYAFWPVDRDFGRATSGLAAGIVFVDWLAALDVPRELSLVFLGLFGATLLFQRLAPAS
ncbi:MAG: UbiA family prenyltransferase [Verrucomicrobiota bacterium]|jgi:4-hydroxybenzoate polyprenyltransferase